MLRNCSSLQVHPGAGEPKRGWTRTAVNFLLDATLLLTFVTILGVSTIVQFYLPANQHRRRLDVVGPVAGRVEKLSIRRHRRLCIVPSLLHVMMHWSWVCGVISNKLTKWRGHPVRINEASKTLWGVGLLILIVNALGLLLAIAALTIHRPHP